MKKIYLFLLLLMTIGMSGFAQNDLCVTIGDSSSYAQTSPLPGYYGWHKSAIVYTSSDLGLDAGSVIQSIAWHNKSVTSGTNAQFTIYLLEISENEIAGTTVWSDLVSNATQVYSGACVVTADSWNTFELQTPFPYNGGNLVVITSGTACGTSGSCAKYCYYSGNVGNAAWTFCKDNTPMDDNATMGSPGSGVNTYHYKFDIRFYYEEGDVTCHAVSGLHAENLSGHGAEIVWNAPEDAGSYILQYKTTSQSWDDPDVVTVDNLYDTAYDLSGMLTPITTYNVRVANLCGNGDTSVWRNISFTTTCAMLTYADLPYVEDFEAYANTAAMSPCLTRISPNSYPTIFSGTDWSAATGKMLYFLPGAGDANRQYLLLPEFENVGGLKVNFYTKRGNANVWLDLGVMTSQSDTSTFSLIGTYGSVAGSSDWANFEIPLSDYNGTDGYIAFRAHYESTTAGTAYILIDDISVVPDNGCSRPDSVIVTNSTTNSADVVIYDAANSGTYLLTWSSTSGSGSATVTGTTYTIQGLAVGTVYDLSAQSVCGGETTTAATTTFSTQCGLITHNDLPFLEDFDAYAYNANALINPCWSRLSYNPEYPVGPYPKNQYCRIPGVGNTFYYYPGEGNAMQYAILPEMEDVSDLLIDFWVYRESTSPRIDVGVMTDPTDTATFELIQSCVPSATSTWEEFEIPFATYSGQGTYITLRARCTGSSAFICIDDIAVREDNCPKPTEMSVTFLGNGQANIEWTAVTEAMEYEVIIEGLDTITVSSNSYTFNGLSSLTDYTARVRTLCGGNNSSNYLTVHFSTPCDTLPYYQDFNSFTTTSSNILPNGWLKAGQGSIEYISATNIYAYNNSPSLKFYGATADNIVVLPNFPAEISELYLQFQTRPEGTSSSTGNFDAGYITDPADANTFVALQTYNYSEFSNAYQEKYVTFSGVPAGARMALRHRSAATSWYWFVDQIEVDYANCPAPGNLAISDLSTNKATITWTTSDNAQEYQIECNGQIFTTIDTFYTITELTPGSTYTASVYTLCSDDTSHNATITFITNCAALTHDDLPYTENFESYTTGSGQPLNPCWRFYSYSTSSLQYVTSNTGYNGSSTKVLYNYPGSGNDYQIVVLPAMDYLNDLSLSFRTRTGLANKTIEVGTMSDANDTTTFTVFQTISLTDPSNWQEWEIPFTSYNGSDTYVALRSHATSVSYYYLDDVVLDIAPTCPRPNELTVTQTTINSVTLSWLTGDQTAWEIAYGSYGFDPDTTNNIVFTNTVPFEVTGLESSTLYQFYVRALCDGGETSPWSNLLSASTQCEMASLPYTENFEAYAGTTYSDANGVIPTCWTNVSNNTTYGAPHVTSSGGYHYTNSGSNCLVFTCGAAGADAYAALPTFDEPLNTLSLNFWRAMESTSSGILTVGYVTDLTDLANTFVEVATIPSLYQQTSGDTISVNFTGSDIPANGNICFHWHYATSYYSCCIDDITVTGSGSGPVITDPTVATNAASAIAQTAATLNATITNPDNVTVTAKGFEWKATTGGTYTQVAGTGTGNTFTANLTDLTANTGYTFKAFITFNGQTVYGSEMTFITLEEVVEPCDVPTGLTASEITKESFTVTWDNNADVSSWNVQYRPQNGQLSSATTTTNHYDFTNLTAETVYEVQVQANCGDNNLSDWSGTLQVTTLVDGIGNYLFNSVSLYPNPAKEVINVQCTMNNVQSVEVIDVYGKVINTLNVTDNPTRINVSGLANGMYFVRVTTEQGVVTKTFVKK